MIDWQPFDFQKKTLALAEVHVWRVLLPLAEELNARFWTLLDAEESARAKRYVFDRDRLQYLAAHGVLRLLIEAYFDIPAAQVRFETEAHGKPCLPAQFNPQQIQFNLSHAHQCILFAFTRQHEIGIDVEYPKDQIDYEGIATRFFSATEQTALRDLPAQQKYIGFYNAWTRKEAYIKAIGEGLSHPLESFDVSLAPDEPARLLRVSKAPEQLAQWTLNAFTPASGYFAALASPQKISTYQFFDANAFVGLRLR